MLRELVGQDVSVHVVADGRLVQDGFGRLKRRPDGLFEVDGVVFPGGTVLRVVTELPLWPVILVEETQLEGKG